MPSTPATRKANFKCALVRFGHRPEYHLPQIHHSDSRFGLRLHRQLMFARREFNLPDHSANHALKVAGVLNGKRERLTIDFHDNV